MSVTVTQSDITNVAPELAGESPERVNIFIEYAGLIVCCKKWGKKAKLATILMVAHLLTMSNREGKGGAVTSETVGDYSQSYGSGTSAGNEELGSTSYGTQYLMLRKTLLASPLIVG